ALRPRRKLHRSRRHTRLHSHLLQLRIRLWKGSRAVLHLAVNLPGLVHLLRNIAGRDAVLDRPEDLMLYEYDAGIRKSTPGAVVFPQNTAQVSQIMRLATAEGVAVVGRGAGAGLSGGSVSVSEGLGVGVLWFDG